MFRRNMVYSDSHPGAVSRQAPDCEFRPTGWFRAGNRINRYIILVINVGQSPLFCVCVFMAEYGKTGQVGDVKALLVNEGQGNNVIDRIVD